MQAFRHKSGIVVPTKERSIMPIMGIKVDSTSFERALNRCISEAKLRLKKGSRSEATIPYLVFTPNPEIIVASSTDSTLAQALNQAHLNVPDGIGVVAAMRYLSEPQSRLNLLRGLKIGWEVLFDKKSLFQTTEVVPGRRLVECLIKQAAKDGLKVFLLGGMNLVAEEAKEKLIEKYPQLQVKFEAGPWLNKDGMPANPEQSQEEDRVIKSINSFQPHFLFVAFGHPKQEKWLVSHKKFLKAGVAMGVGGTLDYLAGHVLPVPDLFANSGFEWLWRLITQPWRIKRIFTATIIFPLKVFLASK